MERLDKMFYIQYGDKNFTNKSYLDEGTTLLIASQGVDNGGYGFFDIKERFHAPIITVPRTGSIGFAFVQLNPCAVTDDCMVLTPKRKMSIEYLFYISAIIRRSKWRFNYGRKITPRRLSEMHALSPEEFKTPLSYESLYKKLYPRKNFNDSSNKIGKPQTKEFQITELFNLERGHFHAIDRLEDGIYPTISRVSVDNGLVGFYRKPRRAKVFSKGLLTISSVTGDAFLQHTPFIATDNVVICIPKKSLQITTLIYIQALLNRVKWRYSYGRQCYKGNFQKTTLSLPVSGSSSINEGYIEQIVMAQPYWREFKERILDNVKN
ncbi:MAG TPA: restriction endonuclease subunit S [candidate division Zixibacteria bacterium]